MNLRVLWMPIVTAVIYHHWCCRYPMQGKIKTKQMKVNWWVAAAVNILHTITVQYYSDVASDGILLIMLWVPQMQKLRPQFLRIQYYQRFLLFCLECLGIWLYFCLLPGIIFYLLISNFLFHSTFFLCHPLQTCIKSGMCYELWIRQFITCGLMNFVFLWCDRLWLTGHYTLFVCLTNVHHSCDAWCNLVMWGWSRVSLQ